MKKKDVVLLAAIALIAFIAGEFWHLVIPIETIAKILYVICRIVGVVILSFLLYWGLKEGEK